MPNWSFGALDEVLLCYQPIQASHIPPSKRWLRMSAIVTVFFGILDFGKTSDWQQLQTPSHLWRRIMRIDIWFSLPYIHTTVLPHITFALNFAKKLVHTTAKNTFISWTPTQQHIHVIKFTHHRLSFQFFAVSPCWKILLLLSQFSKYELVNQRMVW